MNDFDDDEILEVLRKRLEQKKIREDAIEFFRGKVERNIPAAVFQFLTAVILCALHAWFVSWSLENTNSDVSNWNEGIVSLSLIFLVWCGYQSLVPHPRDRLLYLLAKDALLKEEGDVRDVSERIPDRDSAKPV
jgi:hypothetical protein